MATYDIPASNFNVSGLMLLWDKIYVPIITMSNVPSIVEYGTQQVQKNQYNLKSDLEATLITKFRGSIYGNQLVKCESLKELVTGNVQDEIIDQEDIVYGEGQNLNIRYRISSNGQSATISTQWRFSEANSFVGYGPQYNLSLKSGVITSENGVIYAIQGLAAAFIELQGTNGKVYGRVYLSNFVLNDSITCGVVSFLNSADVGSTRCPIFFGGVQGTPQPITNIKGNAVFVDINDPNDPNNPFKPKDPYEPGGESGEGGGNGTFDDDSDPIDIPSLPTLSSANTGFTRIYNPTLSQVQNLANYLWTDESVIQTIWNHIKQYFENPMDAMIGFNLVPVPVPDGGTENFKLMYIDTGVSMTVAASQFVDVDCGTLTLEPYYGSALDYSPYTKISCFLPYIGNVSLNVDEVMGRTLQVKYRVDICSGSCVAYIVVDGTVLYQYSGHCAIPIPFSSADFSSYVNSAISVGKLAGAALIGGAGAAFASTAQDATQQTNQVVTTQVTTTRRQPSTGQQIVTGTATHVQTRETPQDQSSTQASFSGLTPQNIANTVGQIMSSKPHIEHSGSFSGNSGYLGVRRPYIIIERPNMCMPADFQQFNGFPCMINLQLGNCSGFTRVQQVQLTGLSATNPEQAEIMELLKSGVIL